MQVGSRAKCAISALIDIEANGRGRAVPLSDIAVRLGVSLSYLEQLFAVLRRASIVDSARGPGGGYRLSKPAGTISISEIVSAFEQNQPDKDNSVNDPGDALWVALAANTRRFLDGVSLADARNGAAGDVAADTVENDTLSGEREIA